jgi:hypothetical protein
VVELVVGLFAVCVVLAVYIARRDRRRRHAGHDRPFVEHGEGKSASYAANLHRGVGGGGAGGG